MNEKTFKGDMEKLRSPERIALLETERVVNETIAGVPCASMIDVGTGTGLWAEAFLALGISVTGIDTNQALLDEALRLVPHGMFKLGSAEKIPAEDKSVDLVFMAHVLHETDTPALVLHEAMRVARQRVAVLEWPYRNEGFGPPIQHRLGPDTINSAAWKAGASAINLRILTNMNLFLIHV